MPVGESPCNLFALGQKRLDSHLVQSNTVYAHKVHPHRLQYRTYKQRGFACKYC